MARITRSAKDLWSLISGSSVLNCKELIEYELGENGERVVNGSLYFKKSSQASINTLKKSVEETHFEFVCKLSKLLNIDAVQCYELFVSYTTYEFKGTQKSLEAQLSNERLTQSLLVEVWHYYFGERLYYLLTLKHILGNWQNDADPYKELYESFLDKYNKNDKANSLITKLINQMEASINSELPTKDTHGVYMTDLLAYHWVTFVLKEQCELLQLMLLFYKDIEHSVEDVRKLFSLFQSHGFGLRQSFQLMLTDENQNILHFIGYLESLVIIQCFELDLLYTLKESGMLNEHYLMRNKAFLHLLNSSILNLGSNQLHSPILLVWLLVAQLSDLPDLSENCSKLGKAAIHLKVFDYLVSALTSPMFSGSGVVVEVANYVVYSLLSIVLSQFDLENLNAFGSLCSLASTVLQYPSIAHDFWKKGEESGFAELFSYCIEVFTIDFNPLLEICSSLCLASSESCSKVIEQLKNLPIFTELWEKVDGGDVAATQESNVWQLIKDRTASGDYNIVIPQGTYGVVLKSKDPNSSPIIQWRVSVNGWQICLKEMHMKLQEMSLSTAYISPESIQRMIGIAKLVESVLKTNVAFRFDMGEMLNVIFSALQRLIYSSSPSLEFVSICISISSILSSNNMSDVWQQLAHIQLLPCMTSSPKHVSDMLSGICMNTGILGQLIASKECVSGEYSVCLAFLDLISNVSLSAEEDDNFLASIIYILRELFSNFHKWFYNDPKQRILIGQKCLNLLHNLFSVGKKKNDRLSKAQELCVSSLLHFKAGKTLLNIVCTGEEVIEQTFLKQNRELGDQIASMIRFSLSVLNRLLLLRHNSVEQSNTEPTMLEAVLFSTPGHSNQPQVVMMVAHYAFQRYNPRLATLAVQLLKRFAKEFPMSLLACFGSEAEAIRDHFLARLNSPYEDVRLKVSILEFLTVCVVQQPGLIEMFINFNGKGNIVKEESTKSCLQCIKSILKENKNETKDLYPSELMCASVEFIHALWAGHQALAMEALKEDPEFWRLECSSVMSDNLSSDNPGINAFIIRTLALEIFYNGRTSRLKLKENLKCILDEIQSKALILNWSKHVHNTMFHNDGLNGSISSLDSSSVDCYDPHVLLTSWRDFLLILAVHEPFKVPSDHRQEILKNILVHLTSELKGNNSRILILLSELFLMLSRHWQGDLMKMLNTDENRNCIFNILNETAQNADEIHPREQLVVVSIAVFTVRMASKSNLKVSNIRDWIVPCCQLLRKGSLLIHQPLDPKNVEGVLKLPIVIVTLLNELVQVVHDWLKIVKSQSTLPLLVSLLIKSLKLNVGLELSYSIITLFLSMASNKKAVEALCNTGFMPEVTLLLSNIQMDTYIAERKNNISPKSKATRVDVYFAFLRFATAALVTLGNYFLPDCWNLVGVFQEAMHVTLSEMKTSSLKDGVITESKIQDAILTTTFILHLSSHQLTWRLEHPKSLEMLLVDVCDCIYGTVAILSKPDLLKYFVLNKRLPLSQGKPMSLESDTLLKRMGSEEDSSTPAEVQDIQQKLYELLAASLTILTKYCPEMYETMSGHTVDYAQWQLLLQINFSIPALERDGSLGFGTILACVNMCLKLLVKNEKTPSPRKNTETVFPVPRHLLMYILEISLAIILSQSTIALTHPDLQMRDKQMVQRELAAELTSMNITVQRFLRRGPLSPAGSSSVSPPTEFPFMKLVSDLVEKLFK